MYTAVFDNKTIATPLLMKQVTIENQQLCVTDLITEETKTSPETIAENAVAKAKLRKNLSHESNINKMIEQQIPNIKRVGHYAIMIDRLLGKGHYGQVFMAYEINGTEGTQHNQDLNLITDKPLVCKVIDRSKLSIRTERMIKNEIGNLQLINSPGVIHMT